MCSPDLPHGRNICLATKIIFSPGDSHVTPFFFLINFIYLFIYGCVGSSFLYEGFLQLRQAGATLIAVRGPLTVTASPVAEHRLQTHRLSSCGSRAELLCGMWDLPRLGLEPVSPALAGRSLTTVPPGKPHVTPYKITFLSLSCKQSRWPTTHLVRADVFGGLYGQGQYIISLKDNDWCRTDWSDDLGRYWATPKRSA